MDGCPGVLRICLTPGYVFDGSVRLQDNRGNPLNWPVGTTTRMRFSWGTGTELTITGTVDNELLVFHMEPDETEQLPRGTVATIDLNYDGDPNHWRPWRTGRIGC